MTTMILLGVFCSAGLVPLIVGLVGMQDPAKKDQARTLMLAGGIILAIGLLLALAGALTPDPEPSGF